MALQQSPATVPKYTSRYTTMPTTELSSLCHENYLYSTFWRCELLWTVHYEIWEATEVQTSVWHRRAIQYSFFPSFSCMKIGWKALEVKSRQVKEVKPDVKQYSSEFLRKRKEVSPQRACGRVQYYPAHLWRPMTTFWISVKPLGTYISHIL